MSTILKALRRLESDKTSRVHRPLREQVVDGAESGRRAPLLLVGLAVFAVGLAIGATALLLWPDNVSRTEPQAAPTVAGPAAAPSASSPRPVRPGAQQIAAGQGARATASAAGPSPPSAPDRSAAPPGAPAVGRASAVAASGGPADESAEPPRTETAAAARATPRTPPGDSADEPLVAVVRPIVPPPLAVNRGDAVPDTHSRPGRIRPAEEALRPRNLLREPEGTPADPPPAEPPEPEPVRVARRAEPPPAPETASPSPVPVILVSRTQWHPSPDRREALIEVEVAGAGSETRRVHEGDVIGPLRVEKIEPSGVVFDYEGTTLRHAVGSER